ncbi:MAG: SUF system NifU family Fe-S cluster assembly protein, partial [Clostridia bacterium]|nr:SUF system NifU family Fe-S cluster assembly protein [Clostridia bacterium]
CNAHGHNPNCGDDITLHIKLLNDVIDDLSFSGSGCAISQSSTSIMIDTLKGKTIDEAKQIANIFVKMIDREELLPEEKKLLGEAVAFQNVANMPARVKCALLAWKTLKQKLDEIK